MSNVLITCAMNIDWSQVMFNQMSNSGPPCFAVEGERFCLRTKGWAGHDNGCIHNYISFEAMIASVVARAEKAEAERDEARDWVRRMHAANTTTCVWCGQQFPPGTPGAGAEVLLQHAKVCHRHPLHAALARAERLAAYVRAHDARVAQDFSPVPIAASIAARNAARIAEKEARAAVDAAGDVGGPNAKA